MRRRIVMFATATAMAATVPHPLAGQDAPLTITLRGAPAGTPVSVVNNGAREQIGRTDANGTVVPNVRAINFGKGERVEVKLDPGGELVLQRSDEPDPECRDAEQRGEPCPTLGFFPWGEVTGVVITLPRSGLTPGLTTTGTTPVTPPTNGSTPRGRITFGVTASLNYFYDFENTIGDQAEDVTVTGDQVVPGYGGFIEASFPGSPIDFGLAANYTKQAFTQSFQSTNALVPTRQSGTVRGLTTTLYGAGGPRWRTVTLRLGAGLTYAYDVLDLNAEYDVGPEESFRRTLSTFKTSIGLNARYDVKRDFGLNLGGSWTSGFGGRDADAAWRIEGGLYYKRSLISRIDSRLN